jgi:hypothetical protein
MTDELEPKGIPEARRAIDEVVRARIDGIAARLDNPEGNFGDEIVLGWFLVVETMAACEVNGEKTEAFDLHVISANTTADRDLTPWAAKGLLHQVLDDPENYLMDYDHFAEEEDG